MKVYVVQYHSNSWGDQEAQDDILGVYTSEEAANARAEKFEETLAWEDDVVSVMDYELDEDVPSWLAQEYDEEEVV